MGLPRVLSDVNEVLLRLSGGGEHAVQGHEPCQATRRAGRCCVGQIQGEVRAGAFFYVSLKFPVMDENYADDMI